MASNKTVGKRGRAAGQTYAANARVGNMAAAEGATANATKYVKGLNAKQARTYANAARRGMIAGGARPQNNPIPRRGR